MRTSPAAHTPALIRLLDERGWDATTVDALAAEVGVSRATFFRMFGSKEDVVFQDHAVLLEELEEALVRTPPGLEATGQALVDAVLRVFAHHTSDPEQAQARYRLLRQSQALRNRELLSSHAYERLFARWLRGRLDGGGAAQDGAMQNGAARDGAARNWTLQNGAARDGAARDGAAAQRRGGGAAGGHLEGAEAMAFGVAGAAVAVHNAALRAWLRAGEETGVLPDAAGAEERLAQQLARIVLELTGPQSPADGAPTVRTVVVTVDDGRPGTDAVLASVRAALEG
jgi:AcrR family transcriptional regulator